MTKHTRRVLELGAGLALALTVVLTAYADWHQRTAARVRADTVRLHILANSDTWDDQLLIFHYSCSDNAASWSA